MKVFLLFILSFILLSALPFLWKKFQFVELGFPFVYMHRSVFESSGYNQYAYAFANLNLAYDLILVAIAVWISIRITAAFKSRM